jgi:hypothetical protein
MQTPHPATNPPAFEEHGPTFGKYISLVPAGDVRNFLAAQLGDFLALLSDLPEADSLKHHPPYTWSIKQVIGHITDTERVFGFRTLWIARGHTAPLVSFDENEFMAAANFDRYPFKDILAEFEHLRRSHLHMFAHFEPDAWMRRGTVNDHAATPRALAYAIAGHAKHHLDIVNRRLSTR